MLLEFALSLEWMKRLYVIAGCNGAGKTTASYTILPDMLECKEFVNADEIAKGLSPFQPDKAAIIAGRMMLKRMKELIDAGEDFAFETTLATKSYGNLIQIAKAKGYDISLIFFWLSSADLAVRRVETRVREGGHSIPEEVIRRRYARGLQNFFKIYSPLADDWMLINNSGQPYELIAEKSHHTTEIGNPDIWNKLKSQYDEKQ